MPSYAFLFRDQRGNDLVAYLASLHSPDTASSTSQTNKRWRLPADAVASANLARRPATLQSLLRYLPQRRTAAPASSGNRSLSNPRQFSPQRQQIGQSLQTPQPAQIDHFAQIIKFGIPNSDMAGHEYLPDKDIASLSLWLAQSTAQPSQDQSSHLTSGDEQ